MDEDFFKDYPPVNGAEPADAPSAESPAPATDAFVLAEPATNGSDADLLDTNGAPPPDDAEPECPAVTEWRAAFAKRLEDKLTNERRVKAERAEHARTTLETMYSRWETAKNAAADANAKSEKDFIRSRDGVISRMSKVGEKPNWDIIPQLVDMTGKYKEGARDTSRMRQVLLRMKTN